MEIATMQDLEIAVQKASDAEADTFTVLLDIADVPALVAVGLEAMREVSAVRLVKDGDVLIMEFNDGDHVHRHRHHVIGDARNVGVDTIVGKWK